ncbi:hypothetical protein EZV62_009557 [Acer yangbiense]|uniref:CCHC-type domain-containing protein n=1 Tax=Acer yangbiense TaxID=1000413 RepID=A0A5C7HZD3_9ROSI|nr:hypothetical protein EZV62_009557 [Acer yangbiense]
MDIPIFLSKVSLSGSLKPKVKVFRVGPCLAHSLLEPVTLITMSENEIASLCNALSIGEKESPAKILDVKLKDKGEQRLALCLVGKVLTSKIVNREAFKDVMKRIWHINGGVEIEAIKDNIFECHFTNLEARKRILSGGPWRFDRAIIIFEEPMGTGDIDNMFFNKTKFWVQVHNLSLLCMSEEIGLFLGNMIREVRNIDLEAGKNGSGRFIRVRVEIKVDEPLRRSLRVDLLGDGSITTMLLRYERVPDFCYKCNRLGHTLGECTVPGDNKEVTKEANIRLCNWMRTTSPPKNHFYGKGNGRLQQGRRDWREGGYGFSGPRDVSRNQDNWRTGKKLSEPDSGRKGNIIVECVKANLETLNPNVACVVRNSSINDFAACDVPGENQSEGCRLSGPKVNEGIEILANQEDPGKQGGVENESSIKDQDMQNYEALGLDPSGYLTIVSDPDPSRSPIGVDVDGVGDRSKNGLSVLELKNGLEGKIVTQTQKSWKRVGRTEQMNQNQNLLGVKLVKRNSKISSGEKSLVSKRSKKEDSRSEIGDE